MTAREDACANILIWSDHLQEQHTQQLLVKWYGSKLLKAEGHLPGSQIIPGYLPRQDLPQNDTKGIHICSPVVMASCQYFWSNPPTAFHTLYVWQMQLLLTLIGKLLG